MSEPTSPQTPSKITCISEMADKAFEDFCKHGATDHYGRECRSNESLFKCGFEYGAGAVQTAALRTTPTPVQPTKSAPVHAGSLPSGESDPSVMPDCAGADTRSSDETAEVREEEMSLRVALDFAEHPRPYPSLQAPADTMEELREALRVLAGAYRAATLPRLSDETVEAWPDDKLAAWARNWHWNDTAEDRPVDPSIYFRDMRMLKAFRAIALSRPDHSTP